MTTSAPTKRNYDDLDAGFAQWLDDHGGGIDTYSGGYNWDGWSAGKKKRAWDQYVAAGSPGQRPSPFAEGTGLGYDKKKAEKKAARTWPDNVSPGFRDYLIKQGVTVDAWYDKGDGFRSDMRAKYHKATANETGSFHFSDADRAILGQAGHSPAEIASFEKQISNLATADDRAVAYDQTMSQARVDAAKSGGLVGDSDFDSGHNPLPVITSRSPGSSAPLPPGDFAQSQNNRAASIDYPNGDQTAPTTDVMSDPFGWSKDQVTDLQNELVKKGFLQPGSFIPGKYDAATIAAYHTVVGSARTSKMAPKEYLDQIPDGAGSASNKAPFTAPAEARTSDVDIKRIVNTTAQSVLGRAATPSEIADVTKRVRAAEDQEYAGTVAQAKADYNNQPGGVNVTQAPSVEDIASSEFGDSTEAQGYRAASAGLGLLNLMRSGG